MHGIKKTEVTEAEREVKNKEREKKLQFFNKLRDSIFEKIEKNIFDEEGLKLTGQLLAKNPDIYTFWNYRKKALLHLLPDQTYVGNDSDYDTHLCNELELTVACLHKNPKSYGAWHHRGWVLMRMKAPNYPLEIKQCEQALSLDERNFHCWDHWRIVCNLANISIEEQIKFSDKKVKENFSNYSAWHYRSTLLPSLFPDQNGSLPVDNTKFLSELEMVHNAFFTDPDDQSSWFYRNWLFKRIDEKPCGILHLYVDEQFNKLFVLFAKNVVLNNSDVTISIGDKVLTNCKWTAADNSRCHRFWNTELDSVAIFLKKLPLLFTFQTLPGVEMINGVDCGDILRWSNSAACQELPAFQLKLSENERSNLELDLAQTLELSKLECDKKWPLLTSIVSMRALNFMKYEKNIFDGLVTLMEIDSSRCNLYSDLASKWHIEKNLISNCFASHLNLAELNLTALYHTEFMTNVTDLNLSKNGLISLSALGYLINLRSLNVSSNKVTNLKGLESLKRLENVDVSSNFIENCEDMRSIVSCTSLKVVNLKGNPISKLSSDKLKSELCSNLIELKL